MPRHAAAPAAGALAQQPIPVPKDMALLFRREVAQFLTSTPAGVSDVDEFGDPIEVEVLAQIERLVGNGQQQSIQLCRAGEATWVTKTDGARQYFPVAGRVPKRVRAADDDEGAQGQEDVPMAAKPAAKRRKAPAAKKAAAAAAEVPFTPDAAEAKKRAAPKAPRKDRKHKKQPPIYEEDEDADYEGGAPVESEAEMRSRVRDALRRGGNRAGTRSEGRGQVKVEENDEVDIASLCGKVSGLDVHSAIDTESHYSRSRAGSVQAPIASGSNFFG
ncbi:hypothetical protein P7C70_g6131, partial [Phenoliferia sp. Uapishka_3]